MAGGDEAIATQRLRRWRRRAFALVLGLLVAECLLRIAFAASTPLDWALHSWRRKDVDDPALRTRGNPDHPANDSNGFRNGSVPVRVDILALGDSQTFGTSVSREEAWPHQLASMADRDVYSAAWPGWGPRESRAALERHIELAPQDVILAVYSGNDLIDAFTSAARRGEFVSGDDDAARSRQAESPIEEAIPHVAPAWDLFAPPPSGGLLRRMSEWSALGSVARTVKRGIDRWRCAPDTDEDAWEAWKGYASGGDGRCEVFEVGAMRTILAPPYRGLALDLADPRVACGLRHTLSTIRSMQERCQKAGATLHVLFIPTKEYVCASLIDVSTLSPAFAKLVTDERAVFEALRDSLEAAGIPVIGGGAALASMTADTATYFPSADGHLNPAGHQAIAEACFEALRTGR